MAAITPTTPAAAAPAAPTPARQGSLIGSDFTTFLKMLTTQMQNQDPLNPIESTDYAVQLATFSGVEQQVRANQLLSDLSAQFSVMGMAQLAGWVGQEARAAAPVQFDGTPVTVMAKPAAMADSAVLVVTDPAGQTVARESLPLGGAPYLWLGAGPTGDRLPAGRYTLSVESRQGDNVLRTDPAEVYARITEARRDGGTVTLVLSGGVEVDASKITALRMP
ncbi:MAG: flagellar basal body rod modification protein [Pseudomonadota bacterium]|jgi:flagellar basal-body rod modification protein FlgD